MKIRNSDLFEQKYYEIYSYITEKDYKIIKNNIKKIKVEFIKNINSNIYDEILDFIS
ncbi:MAG TPA: hypothetical protein PLV83_02930 [Bacilli bacterium]|nr:hypothetical protein [Bacilli bacterium]